MKVRLVHASCDCNYCEEERRDEVSMKGLGSKGHFLAMRDYINKCIKESRNNKDYDSAVRFYCPECWSKKYNEFSIDAEYITAFYESANAGFKRKTRYVVRLRK